MPIQIPPNALGNPFSKWELTIKETYSLDGLYKRIHDFLDEEGWVDLNGSTLDNGGSEYEDYYFQRNQGDMKFHVIWWRATKRPKVHGNNYAQFYMLLDFATIAVKEKEVIHRGNKVGLQSGDLRITAQFFLVAEDENPGSSGKEWKDNSILSFAKKRFWNQTHKGVLGACKGELATFSNDIYELIQKYTGVMVEGNVRDFTPVKGTHN